MKKLLIYLLPLFFVFFNSCKEDQIEVAPEIGLDPKPTAVFTHSVTDKADPFTVTFKNESVNAVESRWTFADDSTSTEASPTHTFLNTGVYNVKLLTLNKEGFWAQKEETITISAAELLQVKTAKNPAGLQVSYETTMNVENVEWRLRHKEGTITIDSLVKEKTFIQNIEPGIFYEAELKIITPKGSVAKLPVLLSSFGLVTDVTNRDNNFTISIENNSGKESSEGSLKLIDNNLTTKMFAGGAENGLHWQFEYFQPQTINAYTMTSANDSPERDPKNWEILASQDGQNWTVLETQVDQAFTERFQSRTFIFTNSVAYSFYRVHITSLKSSGSFQLTEFRFLEVPQ